MLWPSAIRLRRTIGCADVISDFVLDSNPRTRPQFIATVV